MKRIFLFFSFILFLFLFSFSCKKKKAAAPVEVVSDSIVVVEDTVHRTSITFILGKDGSEYNQYYALANHYYRIHPEDKTETVIDSINSISDVCRFLANHPPENGCPYGLINLVSHGNEFVDLSARVYPKGPRTSVATLQQALQDSLFTPLDTALIDAKTLIFLHGCAVGNNPGLLSLLAKAFGSDQNGVQVKASKLFEYYAYLSKNKNPKSIRHYYARAWYAFYNPDFIPDEEALVRQLEERYPSEQTDWEAGVMRRFQSNPGEIYHHSFIVPVVWEETYENEAGAPSLNSKAKRDAWLQSIPDFWDLLGQTQIPPEYFQFKYYKSLDDGEIPHQIILSVRARAGVICLVQPLVAAETGSIAPFTPFVPAENNPAFFEFAK